VKFAGKVQHQPKKQHFFNDGFDKDNKKKIFPHHQQKWRQDDNNNFNEKKNDDEHQKFQPEQKKLQNNKDGKWEKKIPEDGWKDENIQNNKKEEKNNDDDPTNAPQKKNDDNENGANKFQKQQKMPFEDDNKIKKFAHSNDLIEQIGQKKGQQFRR